MLRGNFQELEINCKQQNSPEIIFYGERTRAADQKLKINL